MSSACLCRNAVGLRREFLSKVQPTAALRGPQYWLRIRSQHSSSQESRLPRLAQTSLWESIIPRGVRNGFKAVIRPEQKRPTNPANYFIWIYLFIGSQAIRILGLKTEYATYMRKADLKIAQLKEVVRKLQNGEEVDVEKALGTGDEVQEREWEEALEEIVKEERLWQSNREARKAERKKYEQEQRDANPVNEPQEEQPALDDPSRPAMAPQAPGFY